MSTDVPARLLATHLLATDAHTLIRPVQGQMVFDSRRREGRLVTRTAQSEPVETFSIPASHISKVLDFLPEFGSVEFSQTESDTVLRRGSVALRLRKFPFPVWTALDELPDVDQSWSSPELLSLLYRTVSKAHAWSSLRCRDGQLTAYSGWDQYRRLAIGFPDFQLSREQARLFLELLEDEDVWGMSDGWLATGPHFFRPSPVALASIPAQTEVSHEDPFTVPVEADVAEVLRTLSPSKFSVLTLRNAGKNLLKGYVRPTTRTKGFARYEFSVEAPSVPKSFDQVTVSAEAFLVNLPGKVTISHRGITIDDGLGGEAVLYPHVLLGKN